MIETEAGRQYQLHPAPARFQESATKQGQLHVLVPTKNESGNGDSETFCGVHGWFDYAAAADNRSGLREIMC